VLRYREGFTYRNRRRSFIRKNDLALNRAMTLRGLVRDAFNPALREREMLELEVRIWIDAGQAFVRA